MTKPTPNPLPPLVQKFFAQHLINERQLSPCTVRSYRDGFRLLFAYFQTTLRRSPSQQRLQDWDAPAILGFLEHLENQRQCCARSRNQRLAAIHCFMRYVSEQAPEHLALAGRVLAIPNKRHPRPLLGYLTADQVRAIVETPDPSTFSGRRDRLLYQLLYNTGARVSEIVGLNRADVLSDTCQTVSLHGKGRKERVVPLWPKTATKMREWLEELPDEPATPVFTNRRGGRLSRSGVEKRLAEAGQKAAKIDPSLKGRQISPHVFRHTTAMHLLQSGVDITAIALWLGHESPVTTHQYVEADLKMKRKTLSRLEEPKTKCMRFKARDSLLTFLEGL